MKSRGCASWARAIFPMVAARKSEKEIISVSAVEELSSSMQRTYLVDHYFRELLQAEICSEAGPTR